MEPFKQVTGVLAPLLRDDIDTDVIIPTPWIKRIGTNLSEGLFGRWRYLSGGIEDAVENPEFVLNQNRFRNCKFLLVGRNFGCGSSREHAVWSLQAFGIRGVIATSYGDIFFSNCSKNGLLAIVLPPPELDILAREIAASDEAIEILVDLHCKAIKTQTGRTIHFEVEPSLQQALLEGLDFIDATLQHEHEISQYLERDRQKRPWIYLDSTGQQSRKRD